MEIPCMYFMAQNMNIGDQGEETEAANQESESSNEIDVVKETIQEEDDKHEDTISSACKEPNQNDSNMVRSCLIPCSLLAWLEYKSTNLIMPIFSSYI